MSNFYDHHVDIHKEVLALIDKVAALSAQNSILYDLLFDIREGFDGESGTCAWDKDEIREWSRAIEKAHDLATPPSVAVARAMEKAEMALRYLGTHPEFDYCYCLNKEQQEDGHAGECKDAREALAELDAARKKAGK